MFRQKFLVVMAAAGVLVPTVAVASPPGFQTSDPALIKLNVGGTVTPIISAGETVDGVMFQGLPDGLGLVPTSDDDHDDDRYDRKRGDRDDDCGEREHRRRRGGDDCRQKTVDVYVSYEQTTVPFPPAGASGAAADFEDASVIRWTLDTSTGRVLGSEVVISPDNGFLRFCSASVAGPNEGFDSYVYFANEETNDIVPVPPGAPYGSDPAVAPQRQGGYAVAVDTRTGDFTTVPGMGRLNRENTVALPGYRKIVTLTGDDTFSATTSQLYMYIAGSQKKLFQDRGHMYAFQVTRKNGARVDASDPFNNANDYLDLGLDDEMSGRFIRVPDDIADGTTGVAPQEALEQWSIDNNVFTFIRVEDIAVDKNDEHVVYVADTGASRVVPDPATGRIWRPPGTGMADNGRVFKFVLDERNPRRVDSFTVLADGDAPTDNVKYVGFTSPDNLDTSTNSLMVQEDASNAQIWQHQFSDGSWTAVADVVDTSGESSGIVDASKYFGPGSWLLDVQAHGLDPVISEIRDDEVLIRREEGQLLLMNIPGS